MMVMNTMEMFIESVSRLGFVPFGQHCVKNGNQLIIGTKKSKKEILVLQYL